MSRGWLHNRFTGNIAKCRSTQWDLTSVREGIEPGKIHRPLIEVYGPHVMSRKRVDTVPSPQAGQMPTKRNEPHAPARSLTTACRACLYQKWQTHYANALQLHILRGSANSTAHDQLACARWISKNLRSQVSSCRTLMHLTCYADQEKRFMQCTATWKETWVKHPRPGNTLPTAN